MNSEVFYFLALQDTPNVGDILAKRLLQHCKSAAAIFEEKPATLAKIEGINRQIVKNLLRADRFKNAEQELLFIEKEKIKPISLLDENYPKRLKHCVDAPILLFTAGNMNVQQQRLISIVGTRNMTNYGLSFCEKLVSDLAPLHPTIVSGFAYGVDICAHKTAIDHNLQTIACLAHGLNQIYPKTHKKYQAAMEENGGFVTDFWSTANPDRENFLKRNRIIAGLTEATIVIESAEKGGSLVTADIANSYDREVFAVPGRATDNFSIGCNNLIKQQKAHVLTSAADLVYMLNWDVDEKATTKVVQKQLFVELSTEEQKVYDYVLKEGKQHLDVIALACNLPIFKASTVLLQMELKGVIKPLLGKQFEAV
ncbi:DNA-processing protein DprA [Zhouia sp. PK063]|uniref:DNA-processing protein DprA n=1 Tax=Zhouia sp. PK063 TaxID=3373602 RepID=UPI003790E440